MSSAYDVAVLGGGPAGSTAALALAQSGHSVVVFESSASRAKIGEILPPVAREPLTRLGLWDRFVAGGHMPCVGTASAWGGPELREHHFIFDAYGTGWHLDRPRFEQMLLAAVEHSDSKVYRGARVTSCEPGAANGDWLLSFALHGSSQRIRARFVVDATGRSATHARRQGARRVVYDRMIGIAAFFEIADSARSNDTRTLIEASECGWWYSARLPKDYLVVVYMSDADLLPRGIATIQDHWCSYLAASTHTRNRVDRPDLRSPLRIVTAASSKLDQMIGNRWIAVGDAALSFDPLSSRGITTAMQSGILAARAIKELAAGVSDALPRYEKTAQRDFENYLSRRRAEYASERRWPNSPFWARRQGSADRRHSSA